MVRNYTIEKKISNILSLIQKPGNLKTDLKILDLGCGTGEFLSACQKKGWEAYGIEPDEKTRDFAKQTYGLSVHDFSLFETAAPHSFDVITLWHALEHIHRLDESLRAITHLVKPNGIVLIAVPNHTSFDAGRYGPFWAAYDVPRHLYHFAPDTIKKLMARHNLALTTMLPMKFDAFYVSLLSEKYIARQEKRSTNYFSALLNGFRSNRVGGKDLSLYSSLTYVLRPAGSGA